MLNLIPLTINLAELPEAERRALCEDAIKRGVPFEHVVREAMIEKARREAGEAMPVLQPN